MQCQRLRLARASAEELSFRAHVDLGCYERQFTALILSVR